MSAWWLVTEGSVSLAAMAILLLWLGETVRGPLALRQFLCWAGAHEVGWTAGHYWCAHCPLDVRGDDIP